MQILTPRSLKVFSSVWAIQINFVAVVEMFALIHDDTDDGGSQVVSQVGRVQVGLLYRIQSWVYAQSIDIFVFTARWFKSSDFWGSIRKFAVNIIKLYKSWNPPEYLLKYFLVWWSFSKVVEMVPLVFCTMFKSHIYTTRSLV